MSQGASKCLRRKCRRRTCHEAQVSRGASVAGAKGEAQVSQAQVSRRKGRGTTNVLGMTKQSIYDKTNITVSGLMKQVLGLMIQIYFLIFTDSESVKD